MRGRRRARAGVGTFVVARRADNGCVPPIVHIRRHPLGPRVYVAGLRIHECWAGFGASLALLAADATDHSAPHHLQTAVALIAAWMMAKDWPDFFPSRRDTYAWRVGVHRRDD
jgi:hypothetical protein